MVTISKHRLVAACDCVTDDNAGGRTKIKNGPIYDLREAQSLLIIHGLRVVNEIAQSDQNAFVPELTDEELSKLILALVPDDRVDSERCRTSVGKTLDCDCYTVRWNRNRCCRWEYGAKLYVKFGFSQNNPRCLVLSIHPSKW